MNVDVTVTGNELAELKAEIKQLHENAIERSRYELGLISRIDELEAEIERLRGLLQLAKPYVEGFKVQYGNRSRVLMNNINAALKPEGDDDSIH